MFYDIHLRAISQEVLMNLIHDFNMCVQTLYTKLLPQIMG